MQKVAFHRGLLTIDLDVTNVPGKKGDGCETGPLHKAGNHLHGLVTEHRVLIHLPTWGLPNVRLLATLHQFLVSPRCGSVVTYLLGSGVTS